LPQQNQSAKMLIENILDQAEQEVDSMAAKLSAMADRTFA
jgi:hypothetical protein